MNVAEVDWYVVHNTVNVFVRLDTVVLRHYPLGRSSNERLMVETVVDCR